MFKLTVDTCVWLDLAKDHRQHSLVTVLSDMQRNSLVSLITPESVLTEFKRNKKRIAQEAARSVRSHFQVVRSVVDKAGGDARKKRSVLALLDDVGQRAPLLSGAAETVLDSIEDLLTAGEIVAATPDIKARATDRALECRALVHRGKNSIADAVILETYVQCVRDGHTKGVRFGFVTHNKNDFSIEGGNHRVAHPDIAPAFSRVKSLYFTSLVDALRRADPTYLSDALIDYSFDQEPRGLQEIRKAEDLLFYQVWYNRHWNRRIAIERGKIKLVSREEWERSPNQGQLIIDDIWKGALASARRVEKTYGKKNLGPWTDFEWGMVNGKLSALRWVLGDEWDMLDT